MSLVTDHSCLPRSRVPPMAGPGLRKAATPMHMHHADHRVDGRSTTRSFPSLGNVLNFVGTMVELRCAYSTLLDDSNP